MLEVLEIYHFLSFVFNCFDRLSRIVQIKLYKFEND